MKIIKKKKVFKAKNSKKELIFKGLVSILSENGYVVRREKLKAGNGWRVVSGQCKFEENKYIFVDTVLGQDEQIDFLIEKIKIAKIQIPDHLKSEATGL